MGKSEDETSVKSGKGSPCKQEQTNIHLYPGWPSFQGYYRSGVPLAHPFFNSAAIAGHVHHQNMWPIPLALIPPYGVPYTPSFPQGVVYAHPGVPFVTTPLSTESLSKLSGNIDQASTKKLKRLDVLAVQVGSDGAVFNAEGSQSVDGIEASCDGSEGNTKAHQSQWRSDSVGTLSTEYDCTVHAQAGTMPKGEANSTSHRVGMITLAPNKDNEIYSVRCGNRKEDTGIACAPTRLTLEDERQLKFERRKQANRESARKSRLRRQAEIEELMKSYESLKVENLTLKSEINRLTQDVEKVKLENAALVEKLNITEL